jgi:hypothetical protein
VDELLDQLASFADDPYGFALWAFPWGEKDTPLENMKLEWWQENVLKSIRDQLHWQKRPFRHTNNLGRVHISGH